MNTDQHKLEPVFNFSNSSIHLYQGKAEIHLDNNVYSGAAEVRLDLLPKANIGIYGKFDDFLNDDYFKVLCRPKIISSFSIDGRKIEGFLTELNSDPNNQKVTLKWSPNSEPVNLVGNESTEMTRVVFHLFNFVGIVGSLNLTCVNIAGSPNLTCDKWKVELKPLPSAKANIKALKDEGGYKLTHIGSIERMDGTSFSAKVANEYLVALNYFFSFARGGWCQPVCPVGFDSSDNRVWESLSSPREPWYYLKSWFSNDGSQLESLFPGFMDRWASDEWRKTLQDVIYWYLNANNPERGIDAGIILTQAAIELLSYEYSVKDKRLITKEGFKDIWASDKFRLLFSSLGIPIDFPEYALELKKLAEKSKWLDAPHALTEIRNSLVHPDHKKRGQLESAYEESWKFGLRLLELGILAICDYKGCYQNRFSNMRVMPSKVPWMQDEV